MNLMAWLFSRSKKAVREVQGRLATPSVDHDAEWKAIHTVQRRQEELRARLRALELEADVEGRFYQGHQDEY